MIQRLLVLTPEAPWPANHGGRVDVLRRLQTLKSLGIEVLLVYWATQNEIRKKVAPELTNLVSDVFVLPERRPRENVMNIVRYPLWIAMRSICRRDLQCLVDKIQLFDPEVILLDHLNAVAGLDQLLAHIKLPFAYRAHNIEHLYAIQQTAVPQTGRDALNAWLIKRGLKRIEKRARQTAIMVMDISLDDIGYWETRTDVRSFWLPNVVDSFNAKALCETADWSPKLDVGYLGNLYATSNVEGVLWFLTCVVPILRKSHPEIQIQIAGSMPVDSIRQACLQQKVALFENPVSAIEVLRNSRVLINPVLQASGMLVKVCEMVFTPAALVSTKIGLVGTPKIVQDCFSIANDSESFAKAILEASHLGNRKLARETFGESVIKDAFSSLNARLAACHS